MLSTIPKIQASGQ